MIHYLVNFFSIFKGYPLISQIIIYTGILLFIVAIIVANNAMYNITFQIRNNFDNTLVKDNITILLGKDNQQINFTPIDGIYSGKYRSGKYELHIKPDLYQISTPRELNIDNRINGEQQIIYINTIKFYSNTSDFYTESIQSPVSSLKQTSQNEITLYTIIETIKNSVGTPLDGLNIGNFEIIEKYQNTERKANIVGLKMLSSSSLNMIFVVDTSASMNSDIPKVKIAMKNFIEKMRLLDNRNNIDGSFAILPVNGSSDEYNNINKFLQIDNNYWYGFKEELNWLNNKIDEFMASGGTPLYSAISLAMNQLDKNNNKSYNIIICLSDGEDNASSNINRNEIAKISKNKQIPIFSIGFGSNLHLADLKYISEQSKGEFYIYNGDMDLVFTNVANSIRKTYELSWKNTGSKIGERVDVQIKVKYKSADKVHETTIDKDYILQSDSIMSKTQQVTQ